MRDYYELQTTDVDKATIKAFGKSWAVSDFLGRVLPQDVGKRVYRSGDILQVENDQQRALRTQPGRKPYCRPWNAGLASEPQAVGRRLGKLLDALADQINENIADGQITQDCWEFRMKLMDNLKADGWQITIPENNYRVKPPKRS